MITILIRIFNSHSINYYNFIESFRFTFAECITWNVLYFSWFYSIVKHVYSSKKKITFVFIEQIIELRLNLCNRFSDKHKNRTKSTIHKWKRTVTNQRQFSNYTTKIDFIFVLFFWDGAQLIGYLRFYGRIGLRKDWRDNFVCATNIVYAIMTGISQQFCVRWNSHLGSLGAAFPQVRQLFINSNKMIFGFYIFSDFNSEIDGFFLFYKLYVKKKKML